MCHLAAAGAETTGYAVFGEPTAASAETTGYAVFGEPAGAGIVLKCYKMCAI